MSRTDGTELPLTSAHDGERSSEVTVDPFTNYVADAGLGGPAFARFLERFRALQDRVVSVNPPEATWDAAVSRIDEMMRLLDPWGAAEKQQPAGTRLDLPGRGNPMLLPFISDTTTDDQVQGRVTFGRFHRGGRGTAHGGTLPLLFDEVLGRLASSGGRVVARTAFLTVNFRNVTPLDVELHVDGTVDLIEGRKRWLSGRLTNGDTLVADAEALFVELLPGQP